MKQLEHEGKRYDIPGTIWEMSLEQFIDLQQASKEPEDLYQQMKLVSIVSGIPLEEVESMDLARFVRLAEICTLEDFVLPTVVTADEAGLNESKQPIRFTITDEDGKEHAYSFQPDFAEGKMKHIAELEDLTKGMNLMENLHFVLAITAWKDGEVWDRKRIEAKARLMLRARMSDVYRPLFFFALQGRTSSVLTRIFSREAQEARGRTASSSVGDGTASRPT